MSHRTQMQVIRRRLTGKTGAARIKELRAILNDLPGYRNGPYADIRKWVNEEIAHTQTRGRVVHRDSIAVRRQGVAQIAIVGAPNAGKSTLLQALSAVQIKTGDYAFTTTRPVPAVIKAGGVQIQLVEIPGLIRGAAEDRGGGRALLGVLRSADAMVLCHASDAPAAGLVELRAELDAAAIDLPTLVAVTKLDEDPTAVDAIAALAADLNVLGVSALDDDSLEDFREEVWRLTGLMRIYLRVGDDLTADPLALEPPVTVAAVAYAIHGELGSRCQGARLWGPSASFDGERVGPTHPLVDGDTVEVIG